MQRIRTLAASLVYDPVRSHLAHMVSGSRDSTSHRTLVPRHLFMCCSEVGCPSRLFLFRVSACAARISSHRIAALRISPPRYHRIILLCIRYRSAHSIPGSHLDSAFCNVCAFCVLCLFGLMRLIKVMRSSQLGSTSFVRVWHAESLLKKVRFCP